MCSSALFIPEMWLWGFQRVPLQLAEWVCMCLTQLTDPLSSPAHGGHHAQDTTNLPPKTVIFLNPSRAHAPRMHPEHSLHIIHSPQALNHQGLCKAPLSATILPKDLQQLPSPTECHHPHKEPTSKPH